jgi:hypothetical protein
LLVSRIRELVESSGIVSGSAVYDAIDDLYSTLLARDNEKEVIGKVDKLRQSISSEGLLSASQFLANITTTTDVLSKLVNP